MPSAYFVVRATVADSSRRQAFDTWYSREHMPDAMKSFGAQKAWRFWSLTAPSLHQATYQFADEGALDRAMKGERLVADFNATGRMLRGRASFWCWRRKSGRNVMFRNSCKILSVVPAKRSASRDP